MFQKYAQRIKNLQPYCNKHHLSYYLLLWLILKIYVLELTFPKNLLPINLIKHQNALKKLYELILTIGQLSSIKVAKISYNYSGLTLFSQMKYEEALKCFNKVIELDEFNWKAYYFSGLILFTLAQYVTALKSIDQGLKIQQNDDMYFQKGCILFKLKRIDEANKVFALAKQFGCEQEKIMNFLQKQ